MAPGQRSAAGAAARQISQQLAPPSAEPQQVQAPSQQPQGVASQPTAATAATSSAAS
ncbi:hypothetical protein CF336_g8059, partial [Tilletia laevis]